MLPTKTKIRVHMLSSKTMLQMLCEKRTHVLEGEGAAVDTNAKADFFKTEGVHYSKKLQSEPAGSKTAQRLLIFFAVDKMNKISQLPSWKEQLLSARVYRRYEEPMLMILCSQANYVSNLPLTSRCVNRCIL